MTLTIINAVVSGIYSAIVAQIITLMLNAQSWNSKN